MVDDLQLRPGVREVEQQSPCLAGLGGSWTLNLIARAFFIPGKWCAENHVYFVAELQYCDVALRDKGEAALPETRDPFR